ANTNGGVKGKSSNIGTTFWASGKPHFNVFNMLREVNDLFQPPTVKDEFDGVANSRMLLFDLTDDPKSPCQFSKQVNGNVLYELGIANAIREPEDILLIRESSVAQIPFDISGLHINIYERDLEVDWLHLKLEKALKEQEWYKSKRVDAAAKAIDEIGHMFMSKFGYRPKGFNHFNINGLSQTERMSVFRLIDLGIVKFESIAYDNYTEYAYHWTEFGREVMKHLGIKLLSMDDFKKTAGYADSLKARDEFRKRKELLSSKESSV
ncbi:MAG: hypothetical protein HY788_23195, partial [Deltaproteobacteria bacterium]|nr:hypothetical protein [Deltaproteobacteria bacterium]